MPASDGLEGVMRLAFYAPFKPLDHPNPSGDQTIGREIYNSLVSQGLQLTVASTLRCRWIYWNPVGLLRALQEINRLSRQLRKDPMDCWVTYHCYYKSPDIIGPAVSRHLGLPYVIIQGSYATKFRRRWPTLPGYCLNRTALLQASLHISDRRHDLRNLQRITARERLFTIQPGLRPEQFTFNPTARVEMHQRWQSGTRPVILTTAMFRNDVKSRGIAWVIECCAALRQQGHALQLVIVGDGPQRACLQQLAQERLPHDVVFTGAVSRQQLYRFYSGGDIFAFPGFRESLGMVYLEAQSCGLPVVACSNGAIPQVVVHGRSGLLSPETEQKGFINNLRTLLTDPQLRRAMGSYAASHIRQHHDSATNYAHIGQQIQNLVAAHNRRP